MKWLLIINLSFLNQLVWAEGNEAGGEWVINRFKARAFDAVSYLCEKQSHSEFTPEQVQSLQDLVNKTEVLATPFESDELFRFEDSKLILNKPLWADYLSPGINVYREVLYIYLSQLSLEEGWETRLNNIKSNDVFPAHKKALKNILNIGRNYIYVLNRAYSYEQSKDYCASLNSDPRFSPLAKWELAPMNVLQANIKELKTQLLKTDWATPALMLAWVSPDQVINLVSGKSVSPDTLAPLYTGATPMCLGTAI